VYNINVFQSHLLVSFKNIIKIPWPYYWTNESAEPDWGGGGGGAKKFQSSGMKARQGWNLKY
jgi:hypothetical protein